MPNLMVTGGCGFIGSNFIRYVLNQRPDICIINIDTLSYAGSLANLGDVLNNPRHTFIRGDIANRSDVAPCFKQKIDAIVHFAAESHVDRSIHDAAPFVRTNIVGTQVLLDAAREFDVDRFVHISTDEVYGSIPPGESATEESLMAPTSPYAASKAASDLLVLSYVRTYQLPALITRCSNNYGPYQFPEKLIPLFITRLLCDEPIPVYGDGGNVRDWIHVTDHCRALESVLFHGKIGSIYNIGGNTPLSNIELTNRLLEVLSKPRSLIRFVADRPGHDRRYAMDCRKIDRQLNWRPNIRFEDGIRETVDWYNQHTYWIDEVRRSAHSIANAYLEMNSTSVSH